MATTLNEIPIPKRKIEIVMTYPVECWALVMANISHDKKTGSLTLNISQGTLCAVEWKEKGLEK